MRSRSFCSPAWRSQVIRWRATLALLGIVACILASVPLASASGEAPAWMRSTVNAPLPAHDEKSDAILLYSETNVTVVSVDKIKTHIRAAYRILRPDGREHGTVGVYLNPHRKVTSLRGWCIPVQGKDYEVKDKDAVEVAPNTEGGELVTDVRFRLLHIPAADPGNVVGYEYEVEEQPLLLQDSWDFQGSDLVQESRYSLQLPAGWEYKVSWRNHAEVKVTEAGNNLWQWSINDVPEIRREEEMPPVQGVVGQMIVSFFPPGGAGMRGFASWQEMGNWYWNLTSGRRDASADIQQKATALSASATTLLAKMQALAQFVQRDIRYVAIELGIGGFQPHPATDVFVHRYGDCKDKATLMSSMLHQIGVDSYYVVINHERGAVTGATPAYAFGFDHMILAIRCRRGKRPFPSCHNSASATGKTLVLRPDQRDHAVWPNWRLLAG